MPSRNPCSHIVCDVQFEASELCSMEYGEDFSDLERRRCQQIVYRNNMARLEQLSRHAHCPRTLRILR
jgi:hypothetical protein